METSSVPRARAIVCTRMPSCTTSLGEQCRSAKSIAISATSRAAGYATGQQLTGSLTPLRSSCCAPCTREPCVSFVRTILSTMSAALWHPTLLKDRQDQEHAETTSLPADREPCFTTNDKQSGCQSQDYVHGYPRVPASKARARGALKNWAAPDCCRVGVVGCGRKLGAHAPQRRTYPVLGVARVRKRSASDRVLPDQEQAQGPLRAHERVPAQPNHSHKFT